MQLKQDIKRYSGSIAILLLLSAWIVYTSLRVFWVGDDLDYMFMVKDAIWDSSGNINSAHDLFTSMYYHYLNVNGRYVAHLLVQLFCGMWGQTAFAICNALVWPIFILLIGDVARVNLSDVRVVAGITLLSLLAFVTKMMPTCQIGFIWMMTLTLVWMLLYRQLRDRRLRWWWLPLLFIFSVLAGNGQEALNLGVGAVLLIDSIRRKFRLKRVEWAMLSGFAIGLGFLCFTPAMFGRMGGVEVSITRSVAYLVIWSPLLWIMLLMLTRKVIRKRQTLREIWQSYQPYLIAICVMVAVNIYIGVYCNRQLFGIELLALIVILRTVRDGRLHGLWLGLLTVLCGVMMYYQVVWIQDSRHQLEQIKDLYLASDNGMVYYDRHRSTDSHSGLMAHYHETAIGYGDSDITHSYCKYLKNLAKKTRYPKIRPTCVQGTVPDSAYNSVTEYYPGHYLILTDTIDPHSICVTEELNIPIPNIARRRRSQDLIHNYARKMPYRIYLIVPQDPYYRIVNVELEAPNK